MKKLKLLVFGAGFVLLGACQAEKAPPPQAAIPLLEWVTDLAAQTTDLAVPDTVEDKVIIDTDDPAAFDAFLTQ